MVEIFRIITLAIVADFNLKLFLDLLIWARGPAGAEKFTANRKATV